jgi:hypothetical protein
MPCLSVWFRPHSSQLRESSCLPTRRGECRILRRGRNEEWEKLHVLGYSNTNNRHVYSHSGNLNCQMLLNPKMRYGNGERFPCYFFFNSSFFQLLFQPIQGPGLLFSSVIIFSEAVGLLGRVISPSQGLYLNKGKHKHNKRIHILNIHALSGIRIHDLSGRAGEDSSCLRPRGYCDRLYFLMLVVLCHVDPLLGKDLEISNYTTAFAKWRLRRQACFHGHNCNAREERCYRLVDRSIYWYVIYW